MVVQPRARPIRTAVPSPPSPSPTTTSTGARRAGSAGSSTRRPTGTATDCRRPSPCCASRAILADQPAWENRVRLAPDTRRARRLDLVLDYTPHPRDRARLEHLVARCRALLAACGCTHVYRENKPAHLGSTHLHGGCRMGDDPRTSVVDPYGRVHGMDNLVVVDGGVMPFPGGVNPTLTIQACALRAARSLAGTLRSRSDGMRETRRTV
ncbi:MAG: GMC family oxidoreductase [Sandaracinaceae bacterium]|nr:GMC family oxidoreductase [Sandaracinaceae bacterium]